MLSDELWVEILCKCSPATALALRGSCARFFGLVASDGFKSCNAVEEIDWSGSLSLLEKLVRTIEVCLRICSRYGPDGERIWHSTRGRAHISFPGVSNRLPLLWIACALGSVHTVHALRLSKVNLSAGVRFPCPHLTINDLAHRLAIVRHQDYDFALVLAASRDATDSLAVIELLLDQPTVQPSAGEHQVVLYACRHGLVPLLERLLDDARLHPSIPPTVLSNCLLSACDRGRTAVVERLLSVDGIDPSDHYSDAVRLSLAHPDILLLLLLDGRIELSPNGNAIFIEACERGYTAVVEHMLTRARDTLDLSRAGHDALCKASTQGHASIVAALLSQPSVDPNYRNDYAVRFASVAGHSDTVRVLLRDPRVNPTAERCFALRLTCTAPDPSPIAPLLLADSRVREALRADPRLCAQIRASCRSERCRELFQNL